MSDQTSGSDVVPPKKRLSWKVALLSVVIIAVLPAILRQLLATDPTATTDEENDGGPIGGKWKQGGQCQDGYMWLTAKSAIAVVRVANGSLVMRNKELVTYRTSGDDVYAKSHAVFTNEREHLHHFRRRDGKTLLLVESGSINAGGGIARDVSNVVLQRCPRGTPDPVGVG